MNLVTSPKAKPSEMVADSIYGVFPSLVDDTPIRKIKRLSGGFLYFLTVGFVKNC